MTIVLLWCQKLAGVYLLTSVSPQTPDSVKLPTGIDACDNANADGVLVLHTPPQRLRRWDTVSGGPPEGVSNTKPWRCHWELVDMLLCVCVSDFGRHNVFDVR
jgi:hypothetical protein